MGISLRFVNSNYHPFTEVLELALLALVLYVATAFSFGLSEPLHLPRWASGRACLGYKLPEVVRLPTLHFPCGMLAVGLAWVIFVGVPSVLPLPEALPPLLPPESWIRKEPAQS